MLLEHKSATEELLVKGTSMEKGIGNSQDQEQPESEAESSSSGIKILQEAELKFSFDSTSPNLIARELALNNATAFGTKADEDTTGVTIWSASLILCHWILEMKDKLKNKHILVRYLRPSYVSKRMHSSVSTCNRNWVLAVVSVVLRPIYIPNLHAS